MRVGERPRAFLLSLVAGFVDTVGFVALFGLFTAHVTGNFVLAGAALARAEQEAVFPRLAMVPVFMAAVAASAMVVDRARARGRDPLRPLLVGEAIGLLVFMATGIWLRAQLASEASVWAVIAVGTAGVIAMGIQNALMREVASSLPATTVMTGNLTQFTIDLVQWLGSARRGPVARASGPEPSARVARTAAVLVGFVIGAGLGAYGIAHFQFWSIALPLSVVAVLAGTAGERTA